LDSVGRFAEREAVRRRQSTVARSASWGRVLATTISLGVGRRVAPVPHPRWHLILTICWWSGPQPCVTCPGTAGRSTGRLAPRTKRCAHDGASERRVGRAETAGPRTWVGPASSNSPKRSAVIRSWPPRCPRMASPREASTMTREVGHGLRGSAAGAGVVARVRFRPRDSRERRCLLASFGAGASRSRAAHAPPGVRRLQAEAAADLPSAGRGMQLLHSQRIRSRGTGGSTAPGGQVEPAC